MTRISLSTSVKLCLLIVQVLLTDANLRLKNKCRPKPSFRIHHGHVATPKNTKYMVAMFQRRRSSSNDGAFHICGGSLISPSVVLSAAHCFIDDCDPRYASFMPSNMFFVVMGNLGLFERNQNTLIYDVKSIAYATEQLDFTSKDKDIAVVFLNGAVPANHPTVQPININRKKMAAGTMCQMSGWGKTGKDSEDCLRLLRMVDVRLISDEVCKKEAIHWTDIPIVPGMICGGNTKGADDACNGDSGGPLVCNGLLTGIISWSCGCGDINHSNHPGVYMDVQYFAHWIDDLLKAKKPNSKSFIRTKPRKMTS